MKWRSDRYIIAIVILALLCRLGLLVVSGHLPALQNLLDVGDAVGYGQLARSLLESGRYRFAAGGPTAFRMPGYPIFLALVYKVWDSPLAVRLVQILLDGVTVWLTWAIARKITDRRIVWYLAPAFVAIHPLLMLTSLTLIAETLTTAILILAVWILIRLLRATSARRRIGPTAFLSLVLAIVIYLRPAAIVVGVFATLFLLATLVRDSGWKQALKTLCPAIIMIAAALSPWILRNYVVMGAFVPLTTSSGVTLYEGNNSDAQGGCVHKLPYILPGMSEIESKSVLTQKAVDWISDNPTRFLALLPRKAIRHWSPISFGEDRELPLPGVLQMVAIVFFGVFYLLVLWGCWTLVTLGGVREMVGLLLVPLALFIVSLIFYGSTRFALPSFPELAVLAAIGISWWRQRIGPFWSRVA